MCGIFGQINKHKQGKFNFPVFTTLGIANDARGGDSCGIFIDGATEYGIGKTKLFADFLDTSELLKNTKKCHIALGHCRKASVGAVDLQRAQPVVIKNENDEVEYVVIHNGTIHNYKELALKYIPFIDITGMSDSQVMARIFYHTGFNVLNEYNGGAVFVIVDYRQQEPLIYAFKGSSKLYSTSQVASDERPFYFTIVNQSLYFSSIYTWLQPFCVDTIYTLPTNTVVSIQDNNTIVHQTIDRSHCIQTQFVTAYQYNNAYDYNYYNYSSSATPSKSLSGEQIHVTVAGLYKTKTGDLVHGTYYVQPNGTIGYDPSAMYLSFWQGILLKNRLCFTFLDKFCDKSYLDEYSLTYCIPTTLNYLSFYPSSIYEDGEYKLYDNENSNLELYDGAIHYIGEDCVYFIENGVMTDCIMAENNDLITQLYKDNLTFKPDYNLLNTMIIKECANKK